jgi:hypothetical protein
MPAVGDHYRPAGDGDSPVYRVVGVDGAVTLLRVTDPEGRRAHTGELRRVETATLAEAFERAADPDRGRSPLGTAHDLLQGVYWDLRKFL